MAYKTCKYCINENVPGDQVPCADCYGEEYFQPKASQTAEAPEIFPATDPVNRPAHYTDGKIEVIDYIEDKHFGFCLGNAVKYISRAGKKDPAKTVEDLRKAIWYIERRIKQLEETEG